MKILSMVDYEDYGFRSNGPAYNLKCRPNAVTKLLDKTKNKCMLDLGCGNRYLVNYLIERGYNAYGNDASEKSIAIAPKISNGRFFVQDLSSDALPPQLQGIPFDTIISTEVIEHLYNSQAFNDFCKLQMRQREELIKTTPYHGYLKNLALSLFNKWDVHMNPLWLGGHIKLWSTKTLTQVFTNSGFTVTGFTGCGRFPYFWMLMTIKAKL
jgi:SAM-dependent methyltransferase